MHLSARRPLSAAVALGAAAAAASLLTVAPSQARATCSGSSYLQVTVVGDVQASERLTPQQICGMYDVHGGPQYYLRRAPLPPYKTQTNPDLLSINQLVQSIPLQGDSTLPLDLVKFVQIIDESGTSHPLSRAQVLNVDGQAFADGLVPAVWFDPSDFMAYIRPLINANDENIQDNINSSSGGHLQVVVHTSGSLLYPSITSTPGAPKAKSPVAFGATFAGPQPGAGATYHWDFGDGATSDKASPSHTYTAECVCGVRLTVTTADGSTGSAASRVTIGPPPKGPSGPATGPTSPTTSGTTPHPGSSGPTSITSSSGPNPTGAPTANAGPTGQPTSGPTDATTSGPTSAPSQSNAPESSGGGTVVAGQLLLASQVYEVPQSPPGSTRTLAATAGAPQPLSRSWKWLGVLVLPALIGLGMAGEALQLRRRRAKMGA